MLGCFPHTTTPPGGVQPLQGAEGQVRVRQVPVLPGVPIDSRGNL